eukprot:6176973-Pleurochrysis_carterae.AAC.3
MHAPRERCRARSQRRVRLDARVLLRQLHLAELRVEPVWHCADGSGSLRATATATLAARTISGAAERTTSRADAALLLAMASAMAVDEQRARACGAFVELLTTSRNNASRELLLTP